MPNIELHGFTQSQIKERTILIRSEISEWEDKDSYVVTQVTNEVVTTAAYEKMRIRPFFRVYYTPEDNLQKLLEFLQGFHHDIEVVELLKFIPER